MPNEENSLRKRLNMLSNKGLCIVPCCGQVSGQSRELTPNDNTQLITMIQLGVFGVKVGCRSIGSGDSQTRVIRRINQRVWSVILSQESRPLLPRSSRHVPISRSPSSRIWTSAREVIPRESFS